MVLTEQQRKFAQEYIVDLNATQAAIRAGYSIKTAHIQGSQLIRNPKVSACIQEAMDYRAKRTAITADRVLAEIGKMAFANTQELYDEDGNLIPVQNLPPDIAAAIHSVKISMGPQGTMLQEIKLHDKKGSLELLGKHLVLFTEKREVTGPNGEPLFADKAQGDDRARKARELMLAELGEE